MIKILFTGNELRQRRRETIINSPAGVVFNTITPINLMQPDYIISAPRNNRVGFVAKFIKIIVSFFKIPNIRYIRKRILTKNDAVYTPGQLLLNNFPYFIEIDNPACLARYDLSTLIKRKKIIEKFLTKKNCRGVICISQAAKKSMARYFSNEVLQKCEVVYPYVKINPHRKNKNFDKIILLACNTKFYMKGTRELLMAYETLRNKYANLELWIVSNTPDEYIQKYKQYSDIHFFPATYSKDELYRDFFSQCDIFVQPSFQDSFGLIYLELIASGKPVVTTDLYAIPEMIIDGYNGYLIKSPLYMYYPDMALKQEYFPIKFTDTEEGFYKKIDGSGIVNDLLRKLPLLIENNDLRVKMSENSLHLLQDRFSEQKRNTQLLNIYNKYRL